MRSDSWIGKIILKGMEYSLYFFSWTSEKLFGRGFNLDTVEVEKPIGKDLLQRADRLLEFTDTDEFNDQFTEFILSLELDSKRLLERLPEEGDEWKTGFKYELTREEVDSIRHILKGCTILAPQFQVMFSQLSAIIKRYTKDALSEKTDGHP